MRQRFIHICSNYAIADTTLHIPHPYEEEMAIKWIQTHRTKYQEGTAVVFAIRMQSLAHLIGAISWVVDPIADCGELGYWIREEEWHKGYCTEAGHAIIPFGFDHFNFATLKAEHMTRNPASGKVLKKLGLKQNAILKDQFKKWDVYEDIAVYSILKSDFFNMKTLTQF